ncbi:MAG: YggS family pyridoxal phosphate-dependent enzyme [Myxococcota bacterium]
MKRKPIETSVRDRVEAVQRRIAEAADRVGRRAEEIRLVGVSKRQPAERVVAAVLAGVAELGESYLQEARIKRPEVESLLARRATRLPRWRMVGHLQRNKAGQAALLFDAIESLDRTELAQELDRRAGQAGRRLEVLLQVNLSRESQKGGVAPEQIDSLLQNCASLAHLQMVGLMTVPALDPDPEASRAAFAHLRELRDRLRRMPGGESLRELSMGMSGDFEIAIEEGATIVRVGTALFGPRETGA